MIPKRISILILVFLWVFPTLVAAQYLSMENRQAIVQVMIVNPDNPSAGSEFGSGFFISQDGYLMTNFHVISTPVWNMDNPDLNPIILIRTTQHTPKYYRCEIVKYDQYLDLAMIKVVEEVRVGNSFSDIKRVSNSDLGNFKFLRIRDSASLVPQDEIFFYGGYPVIQNRIIEGQMLFTETAINLHRNVNNGIVLETEFNKKIVGGSSGGPLLDSEGNVVAIVSGFFLKYSGVDVSLSKVGVFVGSRAFYHVMTEDVLEDLHLTGTNIYPSKKAWIWLSLMDPYATESYTLHVKIDRTNQEDSPCVSESWEGEVLMAPKEGIVQGVLNVWGFCWDTDVEVTVSVPRKSYYQNFTYQVSSQSIMHTQKNMIPYLDQSLDYYRLFHGGMIYRNMVYFEEQLFHPPFHE